MKFQSLILLLFFLSLSEMAYSQYLLGKVEDGNGLPLAAASVFIREKKQGVISNDAGEFRVSLPPGTYHIECSCLGYSSETEQIVVKAGEPEIFLKMILLPKYFELKEVIVGAGEDPAYEIMRKAIGKAPFYRSQIKESVYEAYIKGSGKVSNIPKLMEKLAGEDLDIYKDKLFLQESFSEIRFTAPDKYEQTVKAFSSSMPNDFNPKDAINVGTASLYTPDFMGFISPLNPKSFAYYRFRFEGFDETEGEIINKIKVIPKLKDPSLLDGYLYIAEGEWNIRHAELTAHPYGMTICYDINYNRVDETVFLPTSYNMDIDVSLMGIKFGFGYVSTLKYLQVQLNDSSITEKKKSKEKKNLNINLDKRYKVKSDSLATQRDSSFWSLVRNLPLNEEEVQSYVRKDSIQAYVDSVKKEELHPRFKWSDLLTGGAFGGDSSRVYLKYDGLARAIPEYNFADGFWAGQTLELGVRMNRSNRLKIEPMAYWAWSRECLMWNVDASFFYAPLRSGKLTLSGGSFSEDYSSRMGMLRIVNTYYTLFSGINLAKFYQKNYARADHVIDIANGLQFQVGAEWAERKMLDIHTTYSFFGDEEDVRSNVPDYPGDLNLQFSRLFRYNIGLRYIPEYYYRIDGEGRKQYVRSRFPAFQLSYVEGFSPQSDYSAFRNLEFSVSQNIRLNVFNRFRYEVVAGTFLGDKVFSYIDYKHFNIADVATGKSFENSYALLDYYTYSTNDYWIQAFVNYHTEYLLLKRLPFLQGKMFSETLHGRFLYTPDKPYYSEWGYSIGLLGAGSVGIFTSFDSFDFNAFGVSVSLPLLQLFGIKK